jgi:hypothetical protein
VLAAKRARVFELGNRARGCFFHAACGRRKVAVHHFGKHRVGGVHPVRVADKLHQQFRKPLHDGA